MRGSTRFERLFREHYRALSAFCLRRLADEDAADVVAEVFTTTWNRLDDVDERHARAWLYGVARRKIAHRWRANGRRSEATNRLLAEPDQVGSHDPADLVSDIDLLGRAARALSASDLELLQLVSWEGLDAEELAIVLGCTPGAATVRVHRMRKRLDEAFDALQSPTTATETTERHRTARTRLENR